MVSWMYDREDVIDAIQKLLSEGRHIQVSGPRKVGKTTILDNLNDRLENQCYYFNCETDVANSPDSIANSMKRLFHTNTPREAPVDSWKEVMYEVFEHLKRKNNDCIIIIDELSDSLDKMMSNTVKIYDLLAKAREAVAKEKNSTTVTKGGGVESLSDKGKI